MFDLTQVLDFLGLPNCVLVILLLIFKSSDKHEALLSFAFFAILGAVFATSLRAQYIRLQRCLTAMADRLRHLDSQHGISLAEVSGVLVVGGLIIAGALKGGELIKLAQIRSGIAEVQKVRAASSTFQQRNQTLPGDFYAANATIGDPIGVEWAGCDGTTDANCDGDGVIEGDGTTGETVLFWQHLTASKLITGIEIDPTPAAAGKVVAALEPDGRRPDGAQRTPERGSDPLAPARHR
jgi:hypothetical protein